MVVILAVGAGVSGFASNLQETSMCLSGGIMGGLIISWSLCHLEVGEKVDQSRVGNRS